MQQRTSGLFLIGWLMICLNAFAGQGIKMDMPETDTLIEAPVKLSPAKASAYLQRLIDEENLWRHSDDTLRYSLSRLVNHYQEPFDSVNMRLKQFPFDSVRFEPEVIVQQDTLPLRWLDQSLFYVDTIPLNKDPLITRKTILMRTLLPDSLTMRALDTIPNLKAMLDSVIQVSDTITETLIDRDYLKSRGVTLRRISADGVDPPLLDHHSRKRAFFNADSSALIISSTRFVIVGDSASPFYIVPGAHLSDSLQMAIATLLDYTYQRDSILLFISDIQGRRTPFWLSAGETDLYRYWLKNKQNDSITIWLGNPSKFNLTMILEEGVSVERLAKVFVDDVPIATATPDLTLAAIKPLREIPVFWKYSLAGSFSLNQNYLTYWAQGGESSFAGMLDLGAAAVYTNRETKSVWTNRARLRYGAVQTKEQGYRVSTDILEVNSQYNKVMINKLDFSSVLYFKSQIAKGYNYPNDSVAISKFLNPGTFTVGVGVEYKPLKNTLINFSALSYKNTFVLDTNNINQTVHGVEAGKRSRQEVGGQLVINNSFTVLDDLKITSAVRLFSNYIEKPQNVDVDWETTFERQLNWFFSIKLNLHLIYNDNIRFPVTLDDGSERKVPRTQFNQFLGLSLSVRL